MNRLWVRFTAMIAGVLFFVFFLQFLSIIVPHQAGWEPRGSAGPPDSEISRRLLDFLALSTLAGLGGGVFIARVVSAPVSAMVAAARRIGQGDLTAEVPVRGSEELRELARTFNKMAADLRQAEVLRRNLMADISHELRTPLTVLDGSLRAALDGVTSLDSAAVAQLHGQTRHLIRLVNDLRELALAESKQLALARQPTDMGVLVDETIQALAPLADDRGVCLSGSAHGLDPVDVDPTRMRQVLFNLLTNALRHTPPGGAVTVEAAVAHGQLLLEVRDTGEGLAPEQLAAVFERFYRADGSRSRETGGTGLGLSIVRAICEAHGGRASAMSDGTGCGSRFIVTLPVAAHTGRVL